ncbi:hypothetical protein BDD12DRAFT_492685 [Trichophaea hybrida]|nr:hypothetical protein BDD12DRAFT_492685 [Trichophaea hybrida]
MILSSCSALMLCTLDIFLIYPSLLSIYLRYKIKTIIAVLAYVRSQTRRSMNFRAGIEICRYRQALCLNKPITVVQ